MDVSFVKGELLPIPSFPAFPKVCNCVCFDKEVFRRKSRAHREGSATTMGAQSSVEAKPLESEERERTHEMVEGDPAESAPPSPPFTPTTAPKSPEPKKSAVVPVVDVTVYKPSQDARIGLTLDGDTGPPRVKALAAESPVSKVNHLIIGQRLLEVNGERVNGHEHGTELILQSTGALSLRLTNDIETEPALAA